jgi:hypothetical protein
MPELQARVQKRKETIAAKVKKEQDRFDAAVERRAKEQVAKLLAEREKAAPSGLAVVTVDEKEKIEQKIAASLQKSSSTPWKPFRRLDIPGNVKDARFEYYFADTTQQGNELALLNEGWEYDMDIAQKLKDRGLAPKRPLKDGNGVDGTYRVNELVLLRIPKEQYAEHQQYYRQQGKIDKETIKHQMRKDIGHEGAHESAKVYTNSFGVAGLNQEQFG